MSLLSFSQNVTKDSTKIQFTKFIVRLIIKDLITGDGAKEEVGLLTHKVSLLENKSTLQNNTIEDLNSQIINYLTAFRFKEQQLNLSQTLSKKLETDLKKEKRKSNIYKLGGGSILLVLGVIILSN